MFLAAQEVRITGIKDKFRGLTFVNLRKPKRHQRRAIVSNYEFYFIQSRAWEIKEFWGGLLKIWSRCQAGATSSLINNRSKKLIRWNFPLLSKTCYPASIRYLFHSKLYIIPVKDPILFRSGCKFVPSFQKQSILSLNGEIILAADIYDVYKLPSIKC